MGAKISQLLVSALPMIESDGAVLSRVRIRQSDFLVVVVGDACRRVQYSDSVIFQKVQVWDNQELLCPSVSMVAARSLMFLQTIMVFPSLGLCFVSCCRHSFLVTTECDFFSYFVCVS